MEATTIEVSGLRKRFGSTVALDGMSFSVLPGQVTGFVGPNGAGKSTTMRVILGLDAPDEGTALIGGRRYASLPHPLGHVGSLLDAAALQPSRTARNHLLWLARSQGFAARRVDEVAEQAGLGPVIRRRAGGYSLGMRQRLGLAAAMLGDPPVLLLDEPFNGLDPEGIVWMRGHLRALAGQGRTVLVSSHLMSELEDTAGHLVVVGRGKVIADTSVAELIAAASGGRVLLRTAAGTEAAAVLAGAGATVAVTGSDMVTVTGLPTEKVVALLAGARVPFAEISVHRASLEEAYLELTAEAVEFRAAEGPRPGTEAGTGPGAGRGPGAGTKAGTSPGAGPAPGSGDGPRVGTGAGR
jgi:ABC-2 type transport system ATP-binding protein